MGSFKNFEEIHGTLLALKRLVETYQFQIDEERKPLEQIVSYTFPSLEKLTQRFLENYNEQSGTLISVVLKIFYQAVYLQIPYYLRSMEVFNVWMTYIKLILSAGVPAELSTPTLDEAQIVRNEKTHHWSNKKWASRIMNRINQKLFIRQAVPRELVPFSQQVSQAYATPFMETFYQLLAGSSSQFLAPKTCIFALKYLYHAMRLKSTAQILNPHLEKLLFDITIPKMTVTTRDDRIWKQDPEEYVRMQDDNNLSSFNIKNAAKDLFENICQEHDPNGVSYLHHFFHYCQAYFSTGLDPRTNHPLDSLKKEALLWGIQIQAKPILQQEKLASTIEAFLEYFVLPELQNPVGFLRARACYVINQFGSFEYQKKENIIKSVEGVYQCILDSQLPVRVAAAIAFSSTLMHEEAKAIIRPGLDKVL